MTNSTVDRGLSTVNLIEEPLCYKRRMRQPLIVVLALLVPVLATAQTADFETYRKQIEPTFLRERPLLNGPCFVCHTKITSRFRLEPLAKGATGWTEAQSRRNFET